MAKETKETKTTTTTVICDNPNCDTVHILLDTDLDAPLGYYLSGSGHLSFGGGPIPELYACSKGCIKPAVLEAFDRNWRNE